MNICVFHILIAKAIHYKYKRFKAQFTWCLTLGRNTFYSRVTSAIDTQMSWISLFPIKSIKSMAGRVRLQYNSGAEWQLPAAAHLKLAAGIIHMQMERQSSFLCMYKTPLINEFTYHHVCCGCCSSNKTDIQVDWGSSWRTFDEFLLQMCACVRDPYSSQQRLVRTPSNQYVPPEVLPLREEGNG